MNLTRCSNGHFYDSDTYASCPHCAGSAAPNKTIAYSAAEEKTSKRTVGDAQEIPPTMDGSGLVSGAGIGINPGVTNATGIPVILPGSAGGAGSFDGRKGNPLDEGKTISIYQYKSSDTGAVTEAPVVGWLVCTKGKSFGRDYRLKSGRNFIGRSSQMDVCLAGENTVSRDRHAIIIHEPRKNVFIAQPGESRELFYVNGDVVLSSVQLKKNDVIQVGDVQLMLIPCCDDVFTWEEPED